jgi:alpha-L-rhamnosidase
MLFRKNFYMIIFVVFSTGLFAEGAGSSRISPKGLKAERLRCEYRTNPLGIDETKPRLSWIVTSSQRGQKQTAYHILAASSQEKLDANQGYLWDTQKVSSDETTCIVYHGKPLKSRMRCYWKVKVWDKNDKASTWSNPAMWSMGLLQPEDWKAQWIGYDSRPERVVSTDEQMRSGTLEGGEVDGRNLVLPPPAYIRKSFSLHKSVEHAVVYSSALGWYQLYLNGKPVGDDYFTPGWTDYNKRVYYNAYDVTDMLQKGKNAMGAILADGWYAGYIRWHSRRIERGHYGRNTRFLTQLHVEYRDGTSEIIATDSSWKASTGPILEADILMGQTYDARKELANWSNPGINTVDWANVNVSNIEAKLQAYPGVTVKKFREIKPVGITEPRKGVFVYDMGTNFAGIVRLKVQSKAGSKITLRYAERLNPDGTVYTANLRNARATDHYICKGRGVESWTPQFTFHGFQYVEITGYPGKPDYDTITGIELTSATPVAGSFQCNDNSVNQLYKNICQSQRANFIDIPTDCPQRDERLGWTGDAQVYARTACMNADVQSFFTKWLIDLRDAQRNDGQFPMVAPSKVAKDDGGPAWADAGVICPWTIYSVYGDRRILKRSYPSMKRFIDFCKKRSTDEMLPPQEYHCFGDWLNINDDTPNDVIYTAYFAHSTKLAAQTAAILGKSDDEKEYYELFEKIKASFNKAYVNQDGKIRGNSQTAYVLALAYDLLDEPFRSRATKHLIERLKERNWHLSTGFVGTKELMLVLAKIGRNDVAYRLFHNDTFPSWLFSIKHGATSIWERWDGWTPEKGFQEPGMNSFAHYSFGAVGQWMFENIGGIRADDTGYKRIIIKPQAGGKLTRAKTSYDSIHGQIVTDWKIRKNRDSSRRQELSHFSLKVNIPANTTATVYIPAEDKNDVYEGSVQAHNADGVIFLTKEKEFTVYKVESGNYHFISEFAR